MQKTKELRVCNRSLNSFSKCYFIETYLQEVSFSRLNNTLCQSATPTFDSSIELCMGHILREPIVGILTTDEDDGDNAKDRKKKKKQSNRLLLRKITKQSYTGNDPVGLRDTCQARTKPFPA